MIRVFVVAGEPSGDRLGAELMAGLKMFEEVEFYGIGGPLMQAQGLKSVLPMSELSVMGIAEVIPALPRLFNILRQTVKAVIATRPDLLITIDSPDFCLRLARRVRARAADIRTVHYVAPSVWAWRPRRARKMAKYIDQVLALLPFEPPLIEAVGLRCDFVGHPVTDLPLMPPEAVGIWRQEQGIDGAPLLLLCPGSRRSEIRRLMPVFAQVVSAVHAARPNLRFALLAAPSVAEEVFERIKSWPITPLCITPKDPQEKMLMMQAANLALAASGSISLELALAGTPMVIAYDMAPLSRMILQRMLKTDTVTLVNLISRSRTVPEFLGKECRSDLILTEVLRQLDQPQLQTEALAATVAALKTNGSHGGQVAAQAVLDGLGRRV